MLSESFRPFGAFRRVDRSSVRYVSHKPDQAPLRLRIHDLAATVANEMWLVYFVSDALFDGRRLRALTVVDAVTREALAIDVDQGIKGEQVVATMSWIIASPRCSEDHSSGQRPMSRSSSRFQPASGHPQ